MSDQPQPAEVTVTDDIDGHAVSASITVLPGPCARLSAERRFLTYDIEYFQRLLKKAAASEKQDILDEIGRMRERRDEVTVAMREQGCA